MSGLRRRRGPAAPGGDHPRLLAGRDPGDPGALAGGDLPFGRVAFGAVRREVCLAYTPEAEPGAYLIVHVGFAIQVLDEAAAREALALWGQI